jgi:glycosyltransferase involved in cell wall biosynthesis
MDSNERKKKVLFISHESSLTGAPILLLNLLRLFKKRDYCNIQILLFRGGQLEDEFRKIGSTFILKSQDYKKEKSIFIRGINYFNYRFRKYKFFVLSRNVDLIISNTLTNGTLVKSFSSLKIPIVTYVHELGSVLKQYNNKRELTWAIHYSDLFACPSKAVAKNLLTDYQVPKDKIAILNYFFPQESYIHFYTNKSIFQSKFFQKFNIPEGKFYLVGMGLAGYRKGIDLFVEIANLVCLADKDIHFTWIGDFEDETMHHLITSKIRDYGLESSITLTGQLSHTVSNLCPFDLFLLTSREDPYPLVVLEAAQVNVPTISFLDSGGIKEFILPECGWCIAEFSISEMVGKILYLKKNRKEIEERGRRAYKKVVEWHSNEKLIFDQFEELSKIVLVSP